MEPPTQIVVPPAPKAKGKEVIVPEGHRQCPTCKQIKPLTREFWWIKKGEKEPYINKCKSCYNLAYYNSPSHIKGKKAFLKRCKAREEAEKKVKAKKEKQELKAARKREAQLREDGR